MTKEQEAVLEKFAQVAAEKGYHQVVCLAAGALVLSAKDWRSKADDVISIAKECNDCSEFSSRLLQIE